MSPLSSQLWDLATGVLSAEVDWSGAAGEDKCSLYAAKFSKDPGGTLIAAGGSGTNEAKVCSAVWLWL